MLIPASGTERNTSVKYYHSNSTLIPPRYLLPVIGSYSRNPKVSSEHDGRSHTAARDFTDYMTPIHRASQLNITWLHNLKSHIQGLELEETFMLEGKGTKDKDEIPQNDSSRKSGKYAGSWAWFSLLTLIGAAGIVCYYILCNQTCNCCVYDARYPLRASSDMCHSYESIS